MQPETPIFTFPGSARPPKRASSAAARASASCIPHRQAAVPGHAATYLTHGPGRRWPSRPRAAATAGRSRSSMPSRAIRWPVVTFTKRDRVLPRGAGDPLEVVRRHDAARAADHEAVAPPVALQHRLADGLIRHRRSVGSVRYNDIVMQAGRPEKGRGPAGRGRGQPPASSGTVCCRTSNGGTRRYSRRKAARYTRSFFVGM